MQILFQRLTSERYYDVIKETILFYFISNFIIYSFSYEKRRVDSGIESSIFLGLKTPQQFIKFNKQKS